MYLFRIVQRRNSMRSLIIAEKPELGRAIAAAIDGMRV